MTKTLNTRIKNKYDTEENWVANDPVLLQGEIAYSIKAIYYIKEDNITISLMHYNYKSHIKKMIVDNEVINETNTEFNF